jgi:sulfite dehydrogenase (cytochrome) subunit B
LNEENAMRRIVIVATALFISVTGAVAAEETVSITLPSDTATLAPGPGQDVATTQCRMCHSLDYVTMQPRGGAAQWQGVVTKMIKVFGAPIGAEDAKTIADYLSAHYGTTN